MELLEAVSWWKDMVLDAKDISSGLHEQQLLESMDKVFYLYKRQ